MAYDDKVEGELVGFTFRSNDGGFAVGRLRQAGQGEVVVVGALGHVSAGQHVRLTGRWQRHAQFGRQFKADQVMVDDPRTLLGLERYLASGAVRGLGPTFARRVVARFGLDTLRVIESEAQRLLEVDGIGKKRLEQIVAHWERDRTNREVHAALRGYGVGQALANRIVEKYGRHAMTVVTGTPYRLAAEVRGVGFRTADHIARAAGVEPDDPARAEAAVVHLLREAESEGHCFLPEGALVERAAALQVPVAVARPAVEALVAGGGVVRLGASDPVGRPVYLPAMAYAEAEVARRLADLAGVAARGAAGDSRVAEAALGIQLSPSQRRAVDLALRSGVAVITGGPGTGKTTIVKVLLHMARQRRQAWLLAAPTGRAARRLAETTGAEARTIHRLLEFNPRTGGFTRSLANPLDADGVLVDEASMVDLGLMASLLEAIPVGCQLVLVGDADQLPSVGPGRVLAELVGSGEVPVATLTEVYRQATHSGIVRNAWRVNRGAMPVSGEKDPAPAPGVRPDFFLVERDDPLRAQAGILSIVSDRLAARGFDPMADVQVITPMHNGALGTGALNRVMQQALNPSGDEWRRGDKLLRVGDRVIQGRNDYDNDIFNGDVGRVLSVIGGEVRVDFEGRVVALTGEQLDRLDLAYAISIHKSQGSEYPAVVVALHRSHRVMLRRNLLYTAMTRARRFCCVVGDRWALRFAVAQPGGAERYTRLADRLSAATARG